MVEIHANLLRVMNDSDFLVILPDDVKYPLYACGASGLWTEKVYPKLPGYLEIARYYFRYWTKERLFPDPEYSVMIFRGTVDAIRNTEKSSERAVWLVNDAAVKLLEDRYGTINTLFHNENIYDLRDADSGSMYYYVRGRHNGKTEALKKMLNNMYGTSKLTMPIPKVGDVELTFDKVVPYDDHVADALRYYANDVLVAKELYEIYKKKEENENMERYIRTTDSTKTLTGYVTDVTVTQTGPDEDCDTVEITLRVPRHVGLSENNYPCSLTGADVKKIIRDHKLTTLAFEDPKAFMEPFMVGAVKPKKVIFNNPATIVLWNDGTKTVVTRQKGDRYNKEEGLALCYMKKALGNSSRVFNDALHAGLKMGEE